MKSIDLMFVGLEGYRIFERAAPDDSIFALENGQHVDADGDVSFIARIKIDATGSIDGRRTAPVEIKILAVTEVELSESERQIIAADAAAWCLAQGLIGAEK
jgi:hypothetical protein